jgi:hypothetical protein
MAYENYSFVTWSDGTPITGDRMAQMSLNIEQVRDANDRKPSGIIQFIESTSNAILGNVIATNSSLIALTNPADGIDKRVTIESSRYYRVTCNFPGFTIQGKGAEDSTLSLKIYQVATSFDAASPIAEYNFTPSPYLFANTAADADVAATSQSYRGDHAKLGAGVYSVVATSGGGLSQQSFAIVVKRTFGTSGSSNAPTISVDASATSKLQFYVEDIGSGS